ncbi:MAG: phosphoenolpyruvate hydrolase family protein [Opitutaceae bacterium]
MPNPWTGKGNPYARTEIIDRLRATIARGESIIAAGAGTGISAKFIEQGGADLIIVYNSGRFRMAGHGSTAGLMAYGDANAIAMEIGQYEVLPVVEEIPVICGVHATDPRRRVIAEPLDAAAVNAAVRKDDWNEYRIRAEGPRIRSWINGVPALDYTEAEPRVAADGRIAVQIHSGGHALVQVKDVVIEELPPTPGAATWAEVGLPPPPPPRAKTAKQKAAPAASK